MSGPLLGLLFLDAEIEAPSEADTGWLDAVKQADGADLSGPGVHVITLTIEPEPLCNFSRVLE